MIAGAWVALAVLVLVVSFGAGWWVSLAAVALALVTWRRRDRATLVASAVAGFAAAALWIYLIPLTAGSELVLALLVLASASIGLLSLRAVVLSKAVLRSRDIAER